MANEQRLIVPAPTVRPRKFGLYSVAEVKAAEPHALMGVEYEKNFNCNWGNVASSTSWCSASVPKTVNESYDGTAGRDQFQLYSLDECAGVSEFSAAKDRAVRRFNMGEERGVEAVLNGYLQLPGSVDISGTPTTLQRSMAMLEEWLDENYGGAGIILGSREAVSILTKNALVRRHGNRLETELGNAVAGSYAFGDAGAEGAIPAAGQTILWATGMIEVRYGPMFVSDPYFIQSPGAEEVQTITITGSPTGGTYTLTFSGQTTGNIAYNANAATIQTALLALSNLDTGDVVVTGTGPFTVTFGGDWVNVNVPQITATASLTGGTAPDVVTATTTQGSGLTDNTFQTLAEKSFVMTLDCAVASVTAVIP